MKTLRFQPYQGKSLYTEVQNVTKVPAVSVPIADVAARGPVNGLGEPDESGSYVQLNIDTRSTEQRIRISFGAAEVLMAELRGILGRG